MNINSSKLSVNDIREQIQLLVPYDDIDIGKDDNLLELGLDSMIVMQLVNQWREAGHDISFSQLLEIPTLSAWSGILS